MKKIILTILLLLISTLAYAKSSTDYTVQQFIQCENFKAGSVTVTNTAASITVTTVATRDSKAIHLYNKSATIDVYYDPTGATAVADASHAVLRAGRDISLSGFKSQTISVVTSSSTATLDFEACS